jgi:ABC-2 type transport system permease protein
MGGCFISVGLLISSLTKNQIVAGMVTFAVFLMLWVINWIGTLRGTDGAGDAVAPVDHRALRRLRAGVIDTKHLVYYMSFISCSGCS